MQEAGAQPILFPSYGLTGLRDEALVDAYRRLGSDCDRFLAFELGQQFAPFGRIYSLDEYAGLLDVPQCVGAKHSSLSRVLEWERLQLRDRRRPEFLVLLNAIEDRDTSVPSPQAGLKVVDILADVGQAVVNFGRDLWNGVAFFGELVSSLGKTAIRPARFRGTSLFFHVETFAFRSVPIIALINFLVGAIVAQQGIFQLRRFGAVTFAADLIGVLILLAQLGALPLLSGALGLFAARSYVLRRVESAP